MLNKAFKIVLAPNAYKECLSASDASLAMKRGVDKAFKSSSRFRNLQYDTVQVPLADGGDGSMKVLIESNNGSVIKYKVQDPLGRTVDSQYGIFRGKRGGSDTIVIEMAQASGLWRLAEREKNSLYTHTYGTGQLLRHALKRNSNVNRVIMFVGGSATSDAGFGMAKALGIDFNYEEASLNAQLEPCNANIDKIESIDMPSLLSFKERYDIHNIEFVVACDVDNPLIGSNGAVAMYGPQKLSDDYITTLGLGADYRQSSYDTMERNMIHMNNVWKRDIGVDANSIAGSGAAGGFAAGCMMYLGGRIESGFEIISQNVGLDAALEGADLVITGEGSIDDTTAQGKVPSGVARHAHEAGLSSVVCVAGMVKEEQDEEEEDYMKDRTRQGMADLVPFALANQPMTLADSVKHAPQLLTERVYRICQLFLHNKCAGKRDDFQQTK